jgi:hypothetical protein
MKNLILTFTLLAYSVSLSAQDYAVALNSDSRSASKIEKGLNQFTSDILLNEEFKYRDFLRQSKTSKANFHSNGKTFTKKELTKLLRKSARSSGTYKEFQELLENTYPKFLRVLSDDEMHLLYERFRKGTFNAYIQNLIENW